MHYVRYVSAIHLIYFDTEIECIRAVITAIFLSILIVCVCNDDFRYGAIYTYIGQHVYCPSWRNENETRKNARSS